MSAMLPRKPSASGKSGPDNADATARKLTAARYDRLLSILRKSLVQSREKIASDAPRTISESYGDMTSLFASSDDRDGVSTLVDLMLGKLDGLHDRFDSEKLLGSSPPMTRLEKILHRQDIHRVLRKVELAIENVTREEREFEEAEAADKNSAREAIKRAKSTRVSPTSGKKRRVLPAESIGYHAHQLKLEYQRNLIKQLDEIEEENNTLDEKLEKNWGDWKQSVDAVKSALKTMDELEGGGDKVDGTLHQERSKTKNVVVSESSA